MADISVLCGVCQRTAPADQFKLSYKYKKVVCPKCFRNDEKQINKEMEVKKEPPKPPKPLGWDNEDEYLERAARTRSKEDSGHFKRIPGSNQVQCTCKNCNFQFKYDPFRKMPRACPYCNSDIMRLKTFSLL